MNDVMFQIVPVFIGLVFLVMLAMIIIWAVKGMGQWKKNNQSPVLTVEATIVAKRMDVTHNVHHHRDAAMEWQTPWIPVPIPGISLHFRWKAATGWNFWWMAGSMAF